MKINQLKEIIREELENALQSKGTLSLGKYDSYSVVNDYPQLVKVLMDYVEMKAPKTTNRLGKTILGDKVTITPQKLGQLAGNAGSSSPDFQDWMEKYGLRGGDIEVTVTNRSAMYPQVSLRTAKHIQTARNMQAGFDRMRQDSNSGLD